MYLDAKCFTNVVIGEASMGVVATKLGLHTVLVIVYMAGALFTIRRR
jgi:hypothetical protein